MIERSPAEPVVWSAHRAMWPDRSNDRMLTAALSSADADVREA